MSLRRSRKCWKYNLTSAKYLLFSLIFWLISHEMVDVIIKWLHNWLKNCIERALNNYSSFTRMSYWIECFKVLSRGLFFFNTFIKMIWTNVWGEFLLSLQKIQNWAEVSAKENKISSCINRSLYGIRWAGQILSQGLYPVLDTTR